MWSIFTTILICVLVQVFTGILAKPIIVWYDPDTKADGTLIVSHLQINKYKFNIMLEKDFKKTCGHPKDKISKKGHETISLPHSLKKYQLNTQEIDAVKTSIEEFLNPKMLSSDFRTVLFTNLVTRFPTSKELFENAIRNDDHLKPYVAVNLQEPNEDLMEHPIEYTEKFIGCLYNNLNSPCKLFYKCSLVDAEEHRDHKTIKHHVTLTAQAIKNHIKKLSEDSFNGSLMTGWAKVYRVFKRAKQ